MMTEGMDVIRHCYCSLTRQAVADSTAFGSAKVDRLGSWVARGSATETCALHNA